MAHQRSLIHVEINPDTFERLIKSGGLLANEFRCLNRQTKQVTQQFWLETLSGCLSQPMSLYK
jgi:hypothetical protein